MYHRQQLAARLTAVLFMVLLIGMTLANLVLPDPTVLPAERRKPASLPNLTTDSVLSGQWMKDYEAYSLDNFPGRDTFRALKAGFLLSVYRQKDNHGIFVVNGSAAKLEAVDEDSVRRAADKIKRLTERYLQDCRVYQAIIPDKAVLVGAGRGYPLPDTARAEALLQEGTGRPVISLRETLSADMYYATDIHWDMSRLAPVVELLGREMDFAPIDTSLTERETLHPFYGGLYGQSALPLAPDTMTLLTAPLSDDIHVNYLNPTDLTREPGPLYHTEDFHGGDPYDVFLGGAQPLVILENPGASSDRELILFRDSFGSSIAPLLAHSYAKVTLIDLRYINGRLLDKYVTFPADSDALFLYSSQILNNADTLRID